MAVLNFKDLFSGSLGIGPQMTTGSIIMALVITFMISMFIYYIYTKTYSGVLYSKNFNISLIVTSMVAAVIMMGISWNLALSLGMVGALSIVRFRTAIKDPKDVTFLFWAIASGIICGVGVYKLAIISSLFIGIILLLFSKRFIVHQPYILMLKFSELDNALLESTLRKHCARYQTRNTTLADKMSEMTIELKIKKDEESALLKELKSLKGVHESMLFTNTGELTE